MNFLDTLSFVGWCVAGVFFSLAVAACCAILGGHRSANVVLLIAVFLLGLAVWRVLG